jgi:hypothetical protein
MAEQVVLYLPSGDVSPVYYGPIYEPGQDESRDPRRDQEQLQAQEPQPVSEPESQPVGEPEPPLGTERTQSGHSQDDEYDERDTSQREMEL